MTNTNRPIRRALVSVFHKEGIEVLAEAFIKAGTEVVSTGSTAKRLAELGVAVTEVSEVTGFPECLDGRVKTLDPHIHAGILADMTNPDHAAQLEKFGIKPFDLVVVNLYPFADTVRSGADETAVIEKIDRHRRPVHGAWRGEEQRHRRHRHRPGRLCARRGPCGQW